MLLLLLLLLSPLHLLVGGRVAKALGFFISRLTVLPHKHILGQIKQLLIVVVIGALVQITIRALEAGCICLCAEQTPVKVDWLGRALPRLASLVRSVLS